VARPVQPRFLARFVKGVTALVAALAGLLAVPAGLYHFGGNPLPQRLPSLQDLSQLLTTPDDGTVFLAVLTWVGWLGWASFALPLIWETITQVAGWQAHRIPGLGAQQRMAGALVAAILALVVSPNLASANAAPTGGPAVPPPAMVTLHNSTAPTLTLTAYTTSQQQLRYEVERGDWLYYIAERFLGDGDRYAEIADLNPQLERQDHRFPDHIEKTWVLRLPDDARDRGPIRHANGNILNSPMSAVETPAQIPGGNRTPADPPLASPAPSITPAQTPTPSSLPSQAPTAAPTVQTTGQPAAQQDPGAAAEQGDDSTIAVASGLASAGMLAALVLLVLRRRRRRQQQHRRVGRRLTTPPNPRPEVAARVAAVPADVARLDTALRALSERLHGRPASDLPDVAAVWLDGSNVAFILAKPSVPASPFAAAAPTAWTLDPEAVLDVDTDEHLSPYPGLMTIASHHDVGKQSRIHLLIDTERPGVLSVSGDRSRSADLLRYLAAEAATSTWGDDAVVVVAGLDAADTANLIALNDGRVQANASVADALARISRRTAANAQALADTGAADTIDGRIHHSEGTTWAPQLLFVADPEGVHADLLAELDQQLAGLPRCAVAIVALTPTATRWNIHVDADGAITVPWLATQHTTASQLTGAQLADLAATITKARPHPQRTTVFDRLHDDFEYPFDEPVPAAAEEWATGTDTHGHLLSSIADEFADEHDAEEAPAAAGGGDQDDTAGDHQQAQAPVPAAGVNGHSHLATAAATARRPLPDDPALDADLAAWNDAEKTRPCIGILGPVTVEAPGFIPDERLRFYAELVVFLAQRGRRGATAEEIIANLWMGEPIGRNSLRVALSRVRRWLGEDADGLPWMPGNSSGEAPYRLKDGYLLDWHLFRRVRARGEARGNAGVADLRAALELVRGVPLDGADHRHGSNKRTPYPWLPNSEIPPYHLTAAIVDTAHTLVDLCLEAGDYDGARWAVDRAWIADPEHTDDHPWQDRMRIAAAEGRGAELRAIVADLLHARGAEALVDLSKSTYAVILELGLDTALQDA